MSDDTQGDVQAALAATKDNELASLLIVDPDPTSIAVVRTPHDWRIDVLDSEEIAAHPRRRRGTVRVFTGDSFVGAVLRRSAGVDTTTVYLDASATKCVAVLNDDHASPGIDPGWRDDCVALTLRTTPEWDYWTGHMGLHPQEAFAGIIEEGQPWISTPPAADMLEMAQRFEATTSARFAKGQRLNSGETTLVYQETIDAKAGPSSASMPIPDAFTVFVAPFVGTAPREVACQIRYRIREGTLTIGYTILNLDQYRKAAFDEIVAGIRDGLAGYAFIDGEAPPHATPVRFTV